jgi:hypothetical protein
MIDALILFGDLLIVVIPLPFIAGARPPLLFLLADARGYTELAEGA